MLSTRSPFRFALPALLVAFIFAVHGAAQVVPANHGANQSLWAGGEFSNFHAGFPHGSDLRLSGIGAFAIFHWTPRYALEAETRFLRFNSFYGETQDSYLIGPRYTLTRHGKLRPFARILIGETHMQYPFRIGSCNCFTVAPSGGVEYRLQHKLILRGVYDYEFLPGSPNFTNEPNHSFHPNGVSVGLSYRLFVHH